MKFFVKKSKHGHTAFLYFFIRCCFLIFIFILIFCFYFFIGTTSRCWLFVIFLCWWWFFSWFIRLWYSFLRHFWCALRNNFATCFCEIIKVLLILFRATHSFLYSFLHPIKSFEHKLIFATIKNFIFSN